MDEATGTIAPDTTAAAETTTDNPAATDTAKTNLASEAEKTIETVADDVKAAADASAAEVDKVAEEVKDAAPAVIDHAQHLAAGVETEIGNAKEALAHLQTSSNAEAVGTIVHVAIAKFEAVIANLESHLGFFKSSTK